MSPRIAGSKGHYELSLVDSGGNAAGVSIKLPSVTTILGALPKNGLDWWGYKIGLQSAIHLTGTKDGLPDDLEDAYTAAKASPHTPQKALKSAGGRGSSVHDEAEALLKGTKTRAQVAALTDGYIDALLKWWDVLVASREKVIAVEVPVFSLKHRYSGTFDYLLLDEDRGVYTLGDFKTSKAIYESHLIQTAAYAEAACELGLIPAGAEVRKEVVRFGVDGSLEVVESTNTIEDFLTVKAVYDLLNPPKQKRGKR